MDCYDDRITLDNFKNPSTYQNDYKPYCDYTKEIYKREVLRTEPPEKECPPAYIDDHESFAKWRDGVHIPFDLLIQPKPIIGTDPRKPFQKLVPFVDTGREESLKNKPRVYMTPAFCMDDVEDPEMKELLCKYMYTTEWRNAEREATGNFKKHEDDDLLESVNLTKTSPVEVQIDLYKPIEERFQRTGKEWDTDQPRALTDPTKEFWIHKELSSECSAGVDPFGGTVSEESKQAISELLSENLLRLPHDSPPPTYAGYKMRLSKGIPLAKERLPAIHPLLTTYQAMTCRYYEDMKK